MNVGFIESLREQRHLSQSDLGELVGVTRQTIAVWEKGERLPSVGQLANVAQALNVPLEVFFEQTGNEPTLLFRADKSEILTPALKSLVLRQAQNYAEIERDLGEISVTPPAMPLNVYDPYTVERLAGEVRDFLGVEHAPLGDVITRLEDRGLKVLLTPLPKHVSGFSAFTASLGSVIVVNETHPVERQFFTALHELAHLICHHQDFAQTLEPTNSKPREDIANHLAGAVLLPRDTIERELRAFRNRWIPEAQLRDMKLRYSVSMRTIIMRAEQIGLISNKQRGQQLGVLNRDYGTNTEPVTLQRDPAPDLLRSRLERLVFQALSLEVITLSRAAEVLGVTVTAIRNRADLWVSDAGSAL
jgi:Zn-dependent peptidase ImmA (M78 family)/DNA-binding XRE family transcriptional regulator